MTRKTKQDIEGFAVIGTLGGTTMAFFLLLLI